MSNVLRVSGRVAVGLLALLFAATVWPTLYRYEHTSWGPAPDILVRINRFTGAVDRLSFRDTGTLAQRLRAYYGGAYANVSDEELEARARAKRPDVVAELEGGWCRIGRVAR